MPWISLCFTAVHPIYHPFSATSQHQLLVLLLAGERHGIELDNQQLYLKNISKYYPHAESLYLPNILLYGISSSLCDMFLWLNGI